MLNPTASINGGDFNQTQSFQAAATLLLNVNESLQLRKTSPTQRTKADYHQKQDPYRIYVFCVSIAFSFEINSGKKYAPVKSQVENWYTVFATAVRNCRLVLLSSQLPIPDSCVVSDVGMDAENHSWAPADKVQWPWNTHGKLIFFFYIHHVSPVSSSSFEYSITKLSRGKCMVMLRLNQHWNIFQRTNVLMQKEGWKEIAIS